MAPLSRVQVRDILRIVVQGRPKLRGRSQDGFELAWHYSDHGVKVVVKRHLPPHDCSVAAEAPLPQPVTQNRDARATVAVVGFLEVSSQRRLYAQHIEV